MFDERQRITASFHTLMEQGPMTASLYMGKAVEEIDKEFGDGYAKKHPELVGQFMQTAAIDEGSTVIAQQVTSAIDHLWRAIEDKCHISVTMEEE